MPYYLHHRQGDTVNISVPQPATNTALALDVEWEIEFEARVSSGDTSMTIAATNISDTINLFFIKPDGNFELRNCGGIGNPGQIVAIPDKFAWNIYKIRHTNNGTTRTRTISINGTVLSTVNPTNDTFGLGALFTNATSLRAGDLKYFKFTDFVNGSNSRFYDARSTSSGSTLPDTVNSVNGTLSNFPTDNSQWVFYATSVRALVLTSGRLGLVTDAQIGTGKKPIVFAGGELKQRATTEGDPVTFDPLSGRARRLTASETLLI